MGDCERHTGSLKINLRYFVKKYCSENQIIPWFIYLLSIAFSFLMAYLLYLNFGVVKIESFYSMIQEYMSIVISASATILAVIIAAFGFYAAITDIGFSQSLLRIGQLENSLFPFLVVSILWSTSIVTAFIFKLLINLATANIMIILFYISVNISLTSLLYTVALIYDTLKLTVYRVLFTEEGIINDLDVFAQKSKSLNIVTIKKYNKYIFLFFTVSVLDFFGIICLIRNENTNLIFSFLVGCIFFAWTLMAYKGIKKTKLDSYYLGANIICLIIKCKVFLLTLILAGKYFHVG